MTCPDCRGTGYRTITVSVVHDGGYLPDYEDVPCACNPEPTDEDAPEYDDNWVPGSAWEDFQPGQIAALYR